MGLFNRKHSVITKEMILNEQFFERAFFGIFGVFLSSLIYNTFLLPNHLVIGGLNGLSIIFNSMFGWTPQTFILIMQIILLIICFFLLGWERTRVSLVWGLVYPFAVSLTAPLAHLLQQILVFDNVLVLVLNIGLLYGISSGTLYKHGIDMGGTDIVVRIVQKYFHVSEGKASLMVQSIIIVCGGFTFGINQMAYAIIILVVYTSLMDKIVLGISDSKLFYVHTNELDTIRDFIINELHTGVTVMESKGGYTREKRHILMCVVPSRDYYLFKETILKVDPTAFLVINDCYEVHNGVKNNNSIF